MAPEPRAYYRDESDCGYTKLIVIQEDGDAWFVTGEDDGGWQKPFRMPTEEFQDDDIVPVGKVTEEQLEEIVETL